VVAQAVPDKIGTITIASPTATTSPTLDRALRATIHLIQTQRRHLFGDDLHSAQSSQYFTPTQPRTGHHRKEWCSQFPHQSETN
jgi:hypothetical protein